MYQDPKFLGMATHDIRLDEFEIIPFLLFRKGFLISYQFHHALELLDSLLQPDRISKGSTGYLNESIMLLPPRYT